VCSTALGAPVLEGRDRMFPVEGRFTVSECPRCRLGVTEPRLADAELARHYPDAYGAFQPRARPLPLRVLSWLRRLQLDLRLRRAPFRQAVGDAPSGRVLDVGCGRGDLAAAFARRGWQASVVDPSPLAVAAARTVGVDARQGSIFEPLWPAASFDVVLFHHSLEHVDKPLEALRRAAELLRPGGRLVVAVPDWGSWQRRVFRSRWFHLDLPRHLQHFTAHALDEIAKRSGLRQVEVRGATSAVGLPGTLQLLVFGRCVAGGRFLRPALLLTEVIYPLTALVGRIRGGDCLYLLAERPRGVG
jgi:SAM-dependent methyltransferase